MIRNGGTNFFLCALCVLCVYSSASLFFRDNPDFFLPNVLFFFSYFAVQSTFRKYGTWRHLGPSKKEYHINKENF